jgi:hypothetical protein
MFLPYYQRSSFTSNHSQSCNLVYFNFYVLRQQTRRQKSLNWMVASNTRIQSPLNFLITRTSVCYCRSKYGNCVTFSKDVLAAFMFWFCPAFWWWDINIYLVFSAFTSRPISLLASIRVTVIFYFSILLHVLEFRIQVLRLSGNVCLWHTVTDTTIQYTATHHGRVKWSHHSQYI